MSAAYLMKSFVSLSSPTPEADKQQLAPQDLSADGLRLPKTAQLELLKSAVPLSTCEGCEIEEEEYDGPVLPSKFDVDLDSELLGTGSE
jgi:hypothetical protein